MKIGILTYHRSNNYGALLQGIALREVLVRMGHQVTFIDYWPAYHRHMYALFSFQRMMSRNSLKEMLGYFLRCVIFYKKRKARIKSFDTFISEQVEPYTSSMDEQYDVIVHGSDQIWRKQQEINSYNPVYFGKHEIKAKLKISYAASMGNLPKNETDRNAVKELLSDLDAISIRESSLKNFVEELGYTNVKHDLDPTLLLQEDFWVNRFNLKRSKERYALYYMIGNSFDVAELKRYSEYKKLKLWIIKSRAEGKDSESNIITAGPIQFLQLIYGAEMVFTSSFHGLAFSLIFNKPFFASFIHNSGRAESLLSTAGLNDRLLLPKSSIPNDVNKIDFSQVNEALRVMAASSIENLNNNLSLSYDGHY